MTAAGDGIAPDAELAERHALRRPLWLAFVVGAAVGLPGEFVGLGGTEFRPPLLIGVFGCVALQAVIVNKAKSLVVVLVALPSRLIAVPPDAVATHWFVAVSLLGTCSAHGSVRLGRPRCEPRPCTGSSAC